jgi:hypothetical protein
MNCSISHPRVDIIFNIVSGKSKAEHGRHIYFWDGAYDYNQRGIAPPPKKVDIKWEKDWFWVENSDWANQRKN